MEVEVVPVADSDKASSIGCRNGFVRILLFLLGIPIVLLIIALVILWLPLPGLPSDPGSKSRNLVAAITVGIVGFSFIVAIVMYLRKILRTASHCMDEYFLSKGLVLSTAYSYGRSFCGKINDVRIEVVLLPSYYLQPWRLYITMHKGVGFLGTIGNRKTVVNRYCVPYHPEGSLSSHFVVSTEPQKMNQLLSNKLFEQAIHKMLMGYSIQDTWELRLYENKVVFYGRQYEFHPKDKENSVEAFFSLLQKIP